jgi:dihydrofolate reductase
MKKISVFNHISLDGFFAGPNGEIDWFQEVHDDEWNRYAQEQVDLSRNTLMFGHTTYRMMKEWWPTPAATQADPAMAGVMNSTPKIVFSRHLADVEDEPLWKHTKVMPRIDRDAIRALKREEDVTILGSGSIVQQLANLSLIDEYALVVVPIVLGHGKPLFNAVRRTALQLVEARSFKNGVVLLRYQAPLSAA